MDVRQVIPRDAIPSVDEPEFGEAYAGEPDDDVIVVKADPPQAYPVRFLNYHEIVNDAIDDRPIAVTWCPLCGSAVVYDRRVGDRTLTFGVSGKLADDDLVMYDRETGSEWKQSLGRCIEGPLAGETLSVLPAPVTTWERYREAHPDGLVLRPPGGESEAASDDDDPAEVRYDAEPYREYAEGDGFGLGAHRGTGGRTWERTDLDPKAVVIGLEAGDDALAVPYPTVADAGGVVSVRVGDCDAVVFATPHGIHAYEDPGLAFEATGDPSTFRADGARWDGETGESDDGRRLDRLPAKRLYAFAWQDDHGADSFYSRRE